MADVQQIQELIESSVKALGYELWGVELVGQGRQQTLRIFIENPEGIGVDDCAAVSHQVSGILDVEDPIKSEYFLEVSSPGMDRPLFKLDHYQQFIGNGIRVKLRIPFDGRRKFSGQLVGVEGGDVVVRVDDEEYVLPVDSIEKANIVSKE
ncbi:Ribosome maturation factor RimP [BD1-7 clade bacterium]|uniref:Ribosome maturation factor RimP n=1 Tax=BD1-7 clade bacterium TaxID=2029982 RepID=A0A5S9MW91_9GAMM|nr:Ribosome maturation factor RimP [BD1-7 clade bacterium]